MYTIPYIYNHITVPQKIRNYLDPVCNNYTALIDANERRRKRFIIATGALVIHRLR